MHREVNEFIPTPTFTYGRGTFTSALQNGLCFLSFLYAFLNLLSLGKLSVSLLAAIAEKGIFQMIDTKSVTRPSIGFGLLYLERSILTYYALNHFNHTLISAI